MGKRRLPRDAKFAPNEQLRRLFTARGKKGTHRRERREAQAEIEHQDQRHDDDPYYDFRSY